MRIALFLLSFSPALLFAQVRWPKELANSASLEWKPTDEKLPVAIRKALDGEFGFDFDKDRPNFCRSDLNGDGNKEFILESPYKRGGPMTAVFESHDGQ